jgi:hypothetical protein
MLIGIGVRAASRKNSSLNFFFLQKSVVLSKLLPKINAKTSDDAKSGKTV